ncbi:MAG TPA: lipid-A-disaccharide synthase N-terminal domain-containing protein [Candidatus Paceibacterota bacterium]
MHNIFIHLGNFDITGWQIIGIMGSALFAGRWVLQVITSRKAGNSVVSRGFWYMSISGNLLLLAYFIFGNTDGVGILSNAFPIVLAGYNLWLIGNKKAA